MVTTKSDSEKFYKMVDELESKKGPNDLEEQIRIPPLETKHFTNIMKNKRKKFLS